MRLLFSRGLQFLARVSQIIARQFEVGFETKRLLASSGCFFVATEFVVSGADVVPGLGIVWPQRECCSARRDRFDVALFTIMLKAELEVILRSLRRRLIDW